MKIENWSSNAEDERLGSDGSAFPWRAASLPIAALLLGYGLVRRGWPGMLSIIAGAAAVALSATRLGDAAGAGASSEAALLVEREDVVLQGEFDEGALSGAARAAFLDFPYEL